MINDTGQRSVTYDTFVIERELRHAPARVFRAFSDLDAKRAWFGNATDDHTLDFRVGGKEVSQGDEPHAEFSSYRFEATYHDIVDDERIIYSYEMYVDGKKLSVSQATILFEATADGTRLTFTEYGAYLDGLEPIGLREQGTSELLDALAASLGG